MCDFFWTSFAVWRTWIGKFWGFFFQWGNTPPHQCCVFHSSFRLLLLFLALGLNFIPVVRLFFHDQPWRAGGRRRCCLHNTAEECEAVSDPCPVLYLHRAESTHRGLAFSTSRKEMNDKGLLLDVSGCCQAKPFCWCCVTVITVTMK